MDKLIERESAPRNLFAAAPALATQFFLIPLAVVGVTVLVYVGFRSMMSDAKSPQDYLAEVRDGGTDRRWPAAYELSRLMADPKVRADRSLSNSLVAAFEASKEDDPRVRRYLALAIGQMDPPLPEKAVNDLAAALDDPDSEARISAIWALGSSGDPKVVGRLLPFYQSDDAGIRKIVVYALGALPGDSQMATLNAALGDGMPDVRWNAALALARHGRHDGVAVIRQMLDRQYVEQRVTREVRQDEDVDPIADVMISGLHAAAALKDDALREPVTGLSKNDQSLKVRQAAIQALDAMNATS